jgi:hypothetical protein
VQSFIFPTFFGFQRNRNNKVCHCFGPLGHLMRRPFAIGLSFSVVEVVAMRRRESQQLLDKMSSTSIIVAEFFIYYSPVIVERWIPLLLSMLEA